MQLRSKSALQAHLQKGAKADTDAAALPFCDVGFHARLSNLLTLTN
jgi:hypothetical protein